MLRLVILGIFLVSAAACLRAEQPAEEMQLREKIAALGDHHFGARQAAMQFLINAGADSAPMMIGACASSDREVAARAFEILYQLSNAADESSRAAGRSVLEQLMQSSDADLARRARAMHQRRRRQVMRQLQLLGAAVDAANDRVTAVYLSGVESPADAVPLLREFPELESLSLGGTRIDDDTLQQVTGLKNLQRLDLFDTRVSDEGLRYLQDLPNLRWLPLGHTNVTDTGLVHLKGMQQLEYLGLRGNRITDDGLVHLVGLKNLTGLYLGETLITDAGLARISHLTKLNYLRLHDTAVSDIGLEHLKPLINLQIIDINDTQISPAGMAQLQQWLPNCQVVTADR